MRMTVMMVVLACGAGTQAADVFQWTDQGGQRHYSNAPSAGAERKPIDVEQGVAKTRMPDEETTAAETPGRGRSAEEQAAFSTSASLRRQALERDLRATERQLGDRDRRLAELERARKTHAGGSVATGGVKTAAGDVRSEEEKSLAAEREELAQRQAQTRSAYAKLKEEVTAKLGTTPAWWIDLR